MRPKTAVKIGVFFCTILLSQWSAGAIHVRLKPQTTATRSIVYLGDLADFEGGGADDLQKLKQIRLFPAPAVGRARLIRKQTIREVLALHGWTSSQVELNGERLIRVYGPPPQPVFRKPEPQQPPQQEAVPKVEEPKLVPKIAVAARPLNRGDILRPEDVTLTSWDLRLPSAPVTDLEPIMGKEVMRPYAPGQPLDARQLRDPILVRRGDLVIVHARAAGVSVRTHARATEDGSLGQLIMLESTDTRQRYAARVVGLQHAEVFASGYSVEPAANGQGDASRTGSARRTSGQRR